MRLGPTRGGYGNIPRQADPFKELAARGPGVGSAADKLFTSPMTRRRRFDNQALGDTPPRDGPFAPSAAGVAKARPPHAKARGRKPTNATIFGDVF